MDFELPEEIQIIKNTMRDFVDRELIPLERDYRPEGFEMPEELYKPLQEKTRAMGFWMLDVPAEYGGADLDLLTRCVIQEEISRSVAIPFRNNPIFGPEVRAVLFECSDEQKERYLYPVIRGEEDRVLCSDRAGRRRRPRGNEDPGGAGRRPLGHQRHQALHHRRRLFRLRPGHGGDRSREARPRRHHLLPGGHGHSRCHHRTPLAHHDGGRAVPDPLRERPSAGGQRRGRGGGRASGWPRVGSRRDVSKATERAVSASRSGPWT